MTSPTFDRGYTDLDDTTAPDAATRAILAGARAQFGRVPPAVARLAHAPILFEAFRAALETFERTSLTPVEREVVVLVFARDVGCHVCTRMHAAIAKRLGAGALAETVLAGGEPDDPKLAALARFVRAAHQRAGDVDAAAWTDFLAAGYTRTQALEVVLGLGAYTLSTFGNRLTGAGL